MNPDRLLLVDDDEGSRDMLARRLKRLGYQVDTASGGAEGLEKIRAESYDLVLLDRSMPEVSGMDVLQEIRASHTLAQLPVIMVTAEAHGEAVAQSLAAGANDYVTKPVDLSAALARIQTQLQRRRTALTLEQSQERYALAVDAANDVVIDWSLDTSDLYVSARWHQMLGLAPSERVRKINDWLDRVHPQDLVRLNQSLASYTSSLSRDSEPEPLEFEHRIRHADGTYRWVQSRCRGSFGSDSRPRITGALTDITAAKFADPLTGLPNRTYLLEQLAAAMERSKADGTPLAVLFCDLDGFKYVNDSFGHTVGDELLAAVAERLEGALHTSPPGRALLTRLGGDEFAVLVEGCGDGSAEAEKILAALHEPMVLAAHRVYVSVSVGIAVCSRHSRNTIEILRDADTAMYRAKAGGKNRYAIFTEEMRERAVEQLALANSVREALSKREFGLAFQPIVSLATGQPVSVEALLRWPSRQTNLQGIDPVIRAAEEAGLMVELGGWVLRESCRRFLSHLCRPGMPRISLNVNVSALQFAGGDFYQQVIYSLNSTGFDPSLLNIEITESAMIKNLDAVTAACGRLKDHGIRLSIDDFGTGYSSLSYLGQIPFDVVKLDRSFLRNLDAEEGVLHRGNTEIVRAVIHLAHAFQMTVVGEGVESHAAMCRLRDLGCEYGQGYYFGVPMELEDTARYLDSFQLTAKEF